MNVISPQDFRLNWACHKTKLKKQYQLLESLGWRKRGKWTLCEQGIGRPLKLLFVMTALCVLFTENGYVQSAWPLKIYFADCVSHTNHSVRITWLAAFTNIWMQIYFFCCADHPLRLPSLPAVYQTYLGSIFDWGLRPVLRAPSEPHWLYVTCQCHHYSSHCCSDVNINVCSLIVNVFAAKENVVVTTEFQGFHCNYQNSLIFLTLYRSRSDRAKIKITELDHRSFTYLLNRFSPLFILAAFLTLYTARREWID